MTKTTTMKKGSLPTFNQTPKFDAPLPILFSCRIRLSEEKRALFKKEYYRQYNAATPIAAPAIGGSTIKSETSYAGGNQLDLKLGFNRIVAADLMGSRDTIQVGMIIKIQQVLGIELITEAELKEAFDSYIKWIFREDV